MIRRLLILFAIGGLAEVAIEVASSVPPTLAMQLVLWPGLALVLGLYPALRP